MMRGEPLGPIKTGRIGGKSAEQAECRVAGFDKNFMESARTEAGAGKRKN